MGCDHRRRQSTCPASAGRRFGPVPTAAQRRSRNHTPVGWYRPRRFRTGQLRFVGQDCHRADGAGVPRVKDLPKKGNIEKTTFPNYAKIGKLNHIKFKGAFWHSIDSHKDIEECTSEIKSKKFIKFVVK